MPLVDLSMVEQRYDAVREVLDGATVKDTATRYGVDRRTLHRWLVRYATEGLGALADKSSKPDRCPHQMAPEIEAPARRKTIGRRVDRAGRISILKHRYHVGRHLAGEAVVIESADGLLHISHNGVVVATHARRHLIDDDDKMHRRAKVTRPAAPTNRPHILGA